MMRSSLARLLGVGLVAGALVSACASAAPDGASTSGGSPSALPSSSTAPPSAEASSPPSGVPSPPVAGSPRPSKPSGGGKGSGTMVLTGTVTFVAVEGGCLGLKADGTDGFKTYELMGGDRAVLTPGARVRVTGR